MKWLLFLGGEAQWQQTHLLMILIWSDLIDDKNSFTLLITSFSLYFSSADYLFFYRQNFSANRNVKNVFTECGSLYWHPGTGVSSFMLKLAGSCWPGFLSLLSTVLQHEKFNIRKKSKTNGVCKRPT